MKNERIFSAEEIYARLLETPKRLCKTVRGGNYCVFYAGHKGLHRIVVQDDSMKWIDFEEPS